MKPGKIAAKRLIKETENLDSLSSLPLKTYALRCHYAILDEPHSHE